jgi:hypothetical protein
MHAASTATGGLTAWGDGEPTVGIIITPEGRRVALAGKRLMVGLLNELVEPYSKGEADTLISLPAYQPPI